MKALLQQVAEIARRAGDVILEVYRQPIEVETKADGSPLTLADRCANELIEQALSKLEPGIPMLSEESVDQIGDERFGWNQYWLIDPLDGTKEFVKRNGEFTVNIALIRDARPVLGVVFTPVQQLTHFAADGLGAFRQVERATPQPISTRKFNQRGATLVASRSHQSEAVVAFRQRLADRVGQVETTALGSSLKIVQVAEGAADIYPRLGLTSEWDTAAAHCVLQNAGGVMMDIQGELLKYNKSSLLNPWFLAAGDADFDWAALCSD